MNWTDGITCSVLRDGDAVAEVVIFDAATDLWTYTARCPQGVGVGTFQTREGSKAAAERAIRTMRGEGEG
jgi:hypothetical protein